MDLIDWLIDWYTVDFATYLTYINKVSMTTSCTLDISALCSLDDCCSASFINDNSWFSSLTLLSDRTSSDSAIDNLCQCQQLQYTIHNVIQWLQTRFTVLTPQQPGELTPDALNKPITNFPSSLSVWLTFSILYKPTASSLLYNYNSHLVTWYYNIMILWSSYFSYFL